MLLVNHALARGHPPFSSFSSLHGVRAAKPLIRHFRHFRQKPPFSGGTKARFTKSTVFGTPITEFGWDFAQDSLLDSLEPPLVSSLIDSLEPPLVSLRTENVAN